VDPSKTTWEVWVSEDGFVRTLIPSNEPGKEKLTTDRRGKRFNLASAFEWSSTDPQGAWDFSRNIHPLDA